MDPRKYLSRTGPKPSGFVLRSPLTKGCAGLSAPFRGQCWAWVLGPPYQDTLAMEKQSCSRESIIKEQEILRGSRKAMLGENCASGRCPFYSIKLWFR